MMRRMGIEAIYRQPHTSKPADGHKVFPYLLRSMPIERPNQVWAMDITYKKSVDDTVASACGSLASSINLASRSPCAARASSTTCSDGRVLSGSLAHGAGSTAPPHRTTASSTGTSDRSTVQASWYTPRVIAA